MKYRVVKTCSADLYEAVPPESMSLNLNEASALLEKGGCKIVANVQRFLVVGSPDGVMFDLHTTGRIEVRTPYEDVALDLAEKVYGFLEAEI